MLIQPAPNRRQELASSHPILDHCNCSMVCAEKIKQNKVVSASHIIECPLENCTLKILEDNYNCSEDHKSKKIHEAKGKALLKAQKRVRN